MLMFVVGEYIEHYACWTGSGYLAQGPGGSGCGCHVEVYQPVMGINKGRKNRLGKIARFPFLFDVHNVTVRWT